MSRDIFVVIIWVGEKFCWHLVDRDQGCCYTPYNAKDSSPQQRIIQSKIPMVPRWRNPGLKVPFKETMVSLQAIWGHTPSEIWSYLLSWLRFGQNVKSGATHIHNDLYYNQTALLCLLPSPHFFVMAIPAENSKFRFHKWGQFCSQNPLSKFKSRLIYFCNFFYLFHLIRVNKKKLSIQSALFHCYEILSYLRGLKHLNASYWILFVKFTLARWSSSKVILIPIVHIYVN